MDFGHNGDLILSIPSLEALRGIFPKARIDFVCGEWGIELMKMTRSVDRVVIFNHPMQDRNRRGVLRPVWESMRLIAKLRSSCYDLSIDLRGNLSSAMINLMSGSSYKAGRDRGRYNYPYNFISTAFDDYEVVNKLDLIRKIDDHVEFTGYKLDIPDRVSVRVGQALGRIGMNRYLIMQPRTPWKPRDWGEYNYRELIRKILKDTEYSIVIVGDLGDREENGRLIEVDPLRIVNLSGYSNWQETAYVMKRAEIFIGSDSGPMHLAAAVGTKVIALMGPGEYPRFAPYNLGIRICVIRHEICHYQRQNNCRQTFEKAECKMGENLCMKEIGTNEVFEAILEME
jgi:ADP-heptose:LPS heptosyltransferase